MRILLFVLSLFLLCSCGNGKLRIPPQPAILGLAFPVYLQSDTAVVRLSDYFSQPEQIKRITPPKGTESEEINDKSILKLRINGPGSPLQNLRIRYEGYNYDIPAISGDSGIRIMTDKLKWKTMLNMDTVYNRWVQFFVFTATVPGMSLMNNQAESEDISDGRSGLIMVPENIRHWTCCVVLIWLWYIGILFCFGLKIRYMLICVPILGKM